MRLYFIVLLFTLASFIISIIVIGELRYRTLKRDTGAILHKKFYGLFNNNDSNDYDSSLEDLRIESSPSGMISSFALQVRGSWRLSQGHIIFQNSFEKLRKEEFEKKLY